MQVEMSFKNISANDDMKTFINGKTEKLNKYFSGKMHIVWTLSAENDTVISHAHVLGNNMEYFSEAIDPNYMTSVESCLSKIERQLKKRKEQLRDNK